MVRALPAAALPFVSCSAVRVLFCDTARCRYQNLDKIIDLVNADGRVTAFYSNPIMCSPTPSIKSDFAH